MSKDDSNIDSEYVFRDEDEIPPTDENVYMIGKMLNFDFENYPEISFKYAYMALVTKLPENIKMIYKESDPENAYYIDIVSGKTYPDSPVMIEAYNYYMYEVLKLEGKSFDDMSYIDEQDENEEKIISKNN